MQGPYSNRGLKWPNTPVVGGNNRPILSLDLYFRRTLTLKSIFRLGLLKMFAVEFFGATNALEQRTLNYFSIYLFVFIIVKLKGIIRYVYFTFQVQTGSLFSCVVQNFRFSDKSIKMLIQPAVIIKCAFYYQLTFRSLIIVYRCVSSTQCFSGFGL